MYDGMRLQHTIHRPCTMPPIQANLSLFYELPGHLDAYAHDNLQINRGD